MLTIINLSPCLFPLWGRSNVWNARHNITHVQPKPPPPPPPELVFGPPPEAEGEARRNSTNAATTFQPKGRTKRLWPGGGTSMTNSDYSICSLDFDQQLVG